MLMCDPELLNITNNVIMGKISLSESQFPCSESENDSKYLTILIICIWLSVYGKVLNDAGNSY